MFAEFINIYGMEILVAILGIIGTAIGYVAKELYKKFLNDQTKKAVAKACVQFVEQVFNHYHGADKLYEAMKRAAKLLNEKGIDCSTLEMETLIEAAVAEFNDAFHKPTIEENATE